MNIQRTAVIKWESNWTAYIGTMPGPRAISFGDVVRANTTPPASMEEIDRAVAAVCDDYRGGRFERQPGVREIIAAVNTGRHGRTSGGDKIVRLVIHGHITDPRNQRNPWDEIPLRRLLDSMRLGTPADRVAYIDRCSIEGERFAVWLTQQAEAMPGGLDYGNGQLWYQGNAARAAQGLATRIATAFDATPEKDSHTASQANVEATAPRLPYRDEADEEMAVTAVDDDPFT